MKHSRLPKTRQRTGTPQQRNDPQGRVVAAAVLAVVLSVERSRPLIRKLLPSFPSDKPAMVAWFNTDGKTPLIRENLLKHQHTFRLFPEVTARGCRRQEITVFTDQPDVLRAIELEHAGVEEGMRQMAVRPRNIERDDMIVELHDERKLSFGQIPKRLPIINKAWVGKDGQPLSRKAVEKAYHRRKAKRGDR